MKDKRLLIKLTAERVAEKNSKRLALHISADEKRKERRKLYSQSVLEEANRKQALEAEEEARRIAKKKEEEEEQARLRILETEKAIQQRKQLQFAQIAADAARVLEEISKKEQEEARVLREQQEKVLEEERKAKELEESAREAIPQHPKFRLFSRKASRLLHTWPLKYSEILANMDSDEFRLEVEKKSRED